MPQILLGVDSFSVRTEITQKLPGFVENSLIKTEKLGTQGEVRRYEKTKMRSPSPQSLFEFS